MIVVADAGPIQYLVYIGAIDVLAPLYQRVLVPQAVARELQHDNTPPDVRSWIAKPPTWCEVHADPPADPTLAFLDPVERAAITLALTVRADGLLIDEHDGREEAEHRCLRVTGTLGVLGAAHLAGLLDFETALAQLRRTNFYISDAIVDGLRQRLVRAKSNKGNIR
jgi:predicted nucleic acid-binding protein